ncbi:hypothetical protein OsJ_29026 [Oryza sativa Japonica Group]|uniref:Uncharacterized protein n=2 Tax=Oryza sativa subsp. japonica TaxID=39947 RepID=A3BXW6_ORYSJ|nr:hypothetical protein OsJ_29026 [Oryza sativa Japonica Group]
MPENGLVERADDGERRHADADYVGSPCRVRSCFRNAPMQRWNLISGNGGTTRWQTGLHPILLLARRTKLSTPSTSFHDLVPPSGRKSIEEEVPAVNAGARRHGAGVATGRRKGLSVTQ